jgi:uncharacterized membrane protein
MNKGWHKNSWVTATFSIVLGATGMLQAYLDSKYQPERDALFVPALIFSSLVLGSGLLLLAQYRVNVRESRKLGSGTGDTSPDRGESASAMELKATGIDTLTHWMRKDEILVVAAISVFLLGIVKVSEILDASYYNIPVTMMRIPMIIALFWYSCFVFYLTVYGRRKRESRSMEAPPRLARSRGQPKEAREE